MEHGESNRPRLGFNNVLFSVSGGTGFDATHSNVIKLLRCKVSMLFFEYKFLEVSELSGVRILAGDSEFLFLVVENIFGTKITDFFPIFMHELCGFEESNKQFPDFGLRELLIVDAFLSVGDFTFQRVGKVVVYDLSK